MILWEHLFSYYAFIRTYQSLDFVYFIISRWDVSVEPRRPQRRHQKAIEMVMELTKKKLLQSEEGELGSPGRDLPPPSPL